MLQRLLFSPSFLFFLLFFLPETQIFTEWYPAKPTEICDLQGDTILWSCRFSYFIIWTSPGPELMHIETSRAFICWCMGGHNPSHCLGTYLTGQEDMWKCHSFQWSCSISCHVCQLLAALLAHGPLAHLPRRAGLLTKAPTNHQVQGWERLQEPGTRLRLRNTGSWGTELTCKSHLRFLSLDQKKLKHELKLSGWYNSGV